MKNIWKEKYQESLTKLADLEETIKQLTKKNEQLEIDLLSRISTTDSPNQPKNETSQSLNKLFNSDKGLKKFEEQTDDLKKQIFTEQKKLFSLPSDSKTYQDLIEKIAKLEKELQDSKQKIEKLQKEIKVSEQQLGANCEDLQAQIEKQKNILEATKTAVKDSSFIKAIIRIIGSYEENLEELLEAQTEITKFNSSFATKRKKTILKNYSDNKQLNTLCEEQAKLTELEMQLEHAQKNSKLISTTHHWKGEPQSAVMIASSMPPQLLIGEIDKTAKLAEDDQYDKEKVYHKTYPKDSFRKYIEKTIKKNGTLSLESLPTRLYNIKTKYLENFKYKKVEDENYQVKKDEKGKDIEPNKDIKSYALLSYVWGRKKSKDDLLSPGGEKSLVKACAACQFLGVDYLWIDQLCINQKSIAEKNYEVPQMQQYYGNSMVTLIAIQTEVEKNDFKIGSDEHKELKDVDLLHILEMITRSKWFTRSWTYQEGFLSRNTIFMFDDYLIDGRYLAQVWALNQPSCYANYTSLGDLNSAKIATPVGWTYCEKGYNSEDKVTLRLDEALRTIKKRENWWHLFRLKFIALW